MRHDLKNHLISIRQLIINNQNDKALQYLDTLEKDYIYYQPRIKTGNIILDGILVQKTAVAHKYKINLSIVADFSFLSGMEDADLCILFGNLLDNAIEASQLTTKEYRFIDIQARQFGKTILYTIKNNCPAAKPGIPLLQTKKSDPANHGIGHISINRIVKKYSGTVQFSQQNNVFTVVCAFPIPLSPPIG